MQSTLYELHVHDNLATDFNQVRKALQRGQVKLYDAEAGRTVQIQQGAYEVRAGNGELGSLYVEGKGRERNYRLV